MIDDDYHDYYPHTNIDSFFQELSRHVGLKDGKRFTEEETAIGDAHYEQGLSPYAAALEIEKRREAGTSHD